MLLTIQELSKPQCNNTDVNNTDVNNTDYSDTDPFHSGMDLDGKEFMSKITKRSQESHIVANMS